jgi:enoyl-CoA hydratase
MAFAEITYAVDAGRAHIVFNRPEKRNALSPLLLQELNDALWEADDDRRVHAVCISGAGSCFSAGYDLGAAYTNRGAKEADDDGPRHRTGATFDDDVWFLERAQRLRMVLFDMHKPVIAKVHGYCLAGGTDIALLSDMIIAADDAQIGFPPARDFGALPNNMWLYNCGPQWAKRLMLTGDLITGNDAAKIGVVMKAVPADVLDREVDGLLDRLALIDPDLLAANKRVINLGLELMGARTLQRLAAEIDARGHVAPGAREFARSLRELGVREAVRARDAKFPDGVVRVDEPEIRDSDGRFVDPS